MKKFFYIMIIVSMTLLTSCQEKELPSISEIDTLPAAELRLAISFGPNNKSYIPFQDKIEKFQAKYPQVKVEIVKVPMEIKGFNNLIKDIDSLPDIIELNPNQVAMSLKDRLEELSPYMNVDIERMSLYHDAEQFSAWSGEYAKLIDAARIDDDMYIVPVRSDTRGVIYNKTVFKELGIAEPTEGWTWEQFIETSQKLRSNNYTTYVFGSLQGIEPIILGLGGRFSSPDHAHIAGYLDSKATIAAFERLSQLSFYDEVLLNNTPHAMVIDAPGNFSGTYRSLTSTDDYALASMPAFNGTQAQNIASITGLAISKNSNHKKAAWELIKFIIGETDEEALHFVANNTLEFYQDRFLADPHPKQSLMIERLIQDWSSIVPSTFYMTTGILEHEYAPTVWNNEDYKNIFEGKDVRSSLERLAKEMEGQMSTFYLKP